MARNDVAVRIRDAYADVASELQFSVSKKLALDDYYWTLLLARYRQIELARQEYNEGKGLAALEQLPRF